MPNPHPDRDYEVALEIPEFTCLCPRMGQPDFATIRIRYVPDHPPGRARELRVPGRHDDRHRLAHAERRRARHDRDRCRRRRRDGRDGGLAVQHAACPKLIGVKLTGALSGWAAPKDVILEVAGILTVKGGTGAIVEYFGPGARSISATGKATICNMGAEIGATCSLFPYDEHTAKYLKATGREAHRRSWPTATPSYLRNDPEVDAEPVRFYDRVIEIDLSTLEPHLVGPHTPDLDRPISRIAAEAEREGYPREISAALVGSCTNSSYEDIGRAAHIASPGDGAKGMTVKAPLMITPGSEQVRATIERDGLLADLEAIGATVLANACGPCIGQWKRDDVDRKDRTRSSRRSTATSRRATTATRSTFAFIGSPETVVGMALTGRARRSLRRRVRARRPPTTCRRAASIPAAPVSCRPRPTRQRSTVTVAPDSERLELLTPFPAWDGATPRAARAAEGGRESARRTTSRRPARGCGSAATSTNISQNMFLGAINAFTTRRHGVDRSTAAKPLPDSRVYKAAGIEWIAVGDENYGEGSSREHAAMEPRFMGGARRSSCVRSRASTRRT